MKSSGILRFLAFICITNPVCEYQVAAIQLPDTVQVHIGAILERISNTVFVNSYLDVYIDLSCSKHLHGQVKSLRERAYNLNNSFHSVRLVNLRNANNYGAHLAYYENHVKMFDLEMIKFQSAYNSIISSHWIQAYKKDSERRKRA